MTVAFTTVLTDTPLALAARRLRDASDPITRADLRSVGRATRAMEMAVAANARKRVAGDRGDRRTERTERGLERSHAAEASVEAERLHSARSARADARWVDGALCETQALEEARGETVIKLQTGGRRITSRDGLESLHTARAITSLDYRAGLLYRDLHEAAREDLPSQIGELQGGAARGAVPFDPSHKTRSQRRAEKIAEQRRLDASIAAALRSMTPVVMLHEVAGEGRTISSLNRLSGSFRDDAARYLRAALDLVAVHYRLSEAG